MTGATGNIYTGLHEYEEMAFLLHFLRENDLFVDVGANVGTYTVLASAVVGARSIAIEPVPATYQNLLDNIHLNHIQSKVVTHNIGIGEKSGELHFTSGLDTRNRVIIEPTSETGLTLVPIKSLDEILAMQPCPKCIKIDVEGFETAVITGAKKTIENKKLQAVILELNGSGKRYGYNDLDTHDKMVSQFNFSPYLYDPKKRELSRIENSNLNGQNTIYVRESATVVQKIQSAPEFIVKWTTI
jgi:FkbM family methyltransferase